jgi:hypothetical protein
VNAHLDEPTAGSNALYLSAFSALKDPIVRTYYDPKRAERKTQ